MQTIIIDICTFAFTIELLLRFLGLPCSRRQLDPIALCARLNVDPFDIPDASSTSPTATVTPRNPKTGRAGSPTYGLSSGLTVRSPLSPPSARGVAVAHPSYVVRHFGASMPGSTLSPDQPGYPTGTPRHSPPMLPTANGRPMTYQQDRSATPRYVSSQQCNEDICEESLDVAVGPDGLPLCLSGLNPVYIARDEVTQNIAIEPAWKDMLIWTDMLVVVGGILEIFYSISTDQWPFNPIANETMITLGSSPSANTIFSLFRLLKLPRLVAMVTLIPITQLQNTIVVVRRSLPNVFFIMLLMISLLLWFALLGMELFGSLDLGAMIFNFNSFRASVLTAFFLLLPDVRFSLLETHYTLSSTRSYFSSFLPLEPFPFPLLSHISFFTLLSFSFHRAGH